jgi:hypothetical protein
MYLQIVVVKQRQPIIHIQRLSLSVQFSFPDLPTFASFDTPYVVVRAGQR